jgi:MFS transporter, LPLT family, lysophospholipid transporter
LPPGFHALIAAQFVSALADNALLIVCIAVLVERGLPAWWAPLLKFSFTLAYVVLAPFVGAWADAMPKGRLMMWMNALKALGALLLLSGVNPLLGLLVVGVGAAAYAPAKYGLVTELVPPQSLVLANGWIEVSTVCAVLLGVALGGVLVSPLMPSTTWALAASLALYALAALLNLRVPASGARYAAAVFRVVPLAQDFWRAQHRLWADPQGALSMAVTTLFWGAAAVLQFAVLRWAADVLGLGLDRGAYLQAVVALGIVAGAAWAGRFVRLHQAARVLPLGVLLGLAVPLAARLDHWMPAIPMLMLVGALGGALVVPMNALLQHRGHVLLSAGRSIAVQGFNENASVLLMLASYAALLALGLDIRWLMALLGATVALGVALLWSLNRRISAAAVT